MNSTSLNLQTHYDTAVNYNPAWDGKEQKLDFHCVGKIDYQAGRSMQRELMRARAAGQCGDSVIICEHPPTLTLGKRTRREDLYRGADEWARKGIDVVHVDRGGGPTYHGPGQLMLYPVISLRERHIGVKEFVRRGLCAIADALTGSFDLPVVATLEPAGVWVLRSRSVSVLEQGKKIACVGLRIRDGITDHGFSVNLCNSLEPYRHFAPCGLARAQVTSVSEELGNANGLERFFVPQLIETMRKAFEGVDR